MRAKNCTCKNNATHTHYESRCVESHLWEWNSSVRRKCSLCSLVCVSLWEKGWKFPWKWKIGFCTIFIDTDSRERTEMFREWHELNFSCMSIMIQCVTARSRHNCVVCRASYRYRFPYSIQMILIQFDANSFGCFFSDIKKENAVHFTYIIIVLYFRLIKSVICLFEKDSADKSFNLGYQTTLVTLCIFDSLKKFSS